jgi:hypothetical protein
MVPAYFILLLSQKTPDDFTCQVERLVLKWVNVQTLRVLCSQNINSHMHQKTQIAHQQIAAKIASVLRQID